MDASWGSDFKVEEGRERFRLCLRLGQKSETSRHYCAVSFQRVTDSFDFHFSKASSFKLYRCL